VHRTYDVAGEIFGVRCTSKAGGEWLDRTFAAYRVDGSPPNDFFNYSIDIPPPSGPGLGRRFATLYVGFKTAVRTHSLQVLAEAVINEFAVWECAQKTDGAFLDAGVILAGNASILVDGPFIQWMGQQQSRARRMGIQLSAQSAVSLDPERRTVVRLPGPNVPGDAVESLAPLLADSGLVDGISDRLRLDAPRRVDAVCDGDWLDGELFHQASGAAMTRDYAVRALNTVASGGDVLFPIASLMTSVPCFTVSSQRPQKTFEAVLQLAEQLLPRGEA
jgi:hypothetical protein